MAMFIAIAQRHSNYRSLTSGSSVFQRELYNTLTNFTMTSEAYLEQLKPLSVHARFAVGVRIFERYVRMRGIEDESVWEYLTYMWEFPTLTNNEKFKWEKKRGELADYGLGDELPEELEEELYSLAINEDYFELWVCNVTELAWTNLLQGPQNEESMFFLKSILNLTIISKIGVPHLEVYQSSQYTEAQGWGDIPSQEMIEQWQSAPCELSLKSDAEELSEHISEQIAL